MMERQKKRYAHTAQLRQGVGSWLKTAPRGSQKQAAAALQVSTRTLRSWARDVERAPRKRGRKRKQISLGAARAVVREWERQGCPGSRPVGRALPQVPLRAVRAIVAKLKKRKRRRCRRMREAHRTSVLVHQAGVLSAMDGATLKWKKDFLVVRDRGSLKTNARACRRRHLRSSDTVELLKELKAQRCLPLVIATDNGSALCSAEVQDFIKRNKVIHLRSLPRVPQHNGSAENAVREFKEVVGLGIEPEAACDLLNHARRRKKLGWQTSLQFERVNFNQINDVDRAWFYRSASLAIRQAMLGKKSSCEKRKAEREAIFQTLERFSLITRTKGHLPLPPKPEVIT